MARRSSLPGADELFRTTSTPTPASSGREPASATQAEVERQTARAAQVTVDRLSEGDRQPAPERKLSTVGAAADRRDPGARGDDGGTARRSGSGVRRVSKAKATDPDHQPSGRERHDEKITVYVSPQELLELERARWVLRAEHGLASDRGRIVREAVAVVLADFEAKGAHSILVTRLQELENR